MQMPDQLAGMSEGDLKAWFLENVTSETAPIDEMLQAIEATYVAGTVAMAETLTTLLQEALTTRQDEVHTLALAQLRVQWRDDDAFPRELRRTLRSSFKSRFGKAFVKNIGLGESGIALSTSLDRLAVLQGLSPDVLCHDDTWGFGVIKSLDDFYAKVTIDFDRKGGHEMTFSYASETLDLIDEHHLLARKHRDEAGMLALAAKNAPEVVRVALASYGDMNVDELQAVISKELVGATGWKKFWEQARRGLKTDPLVDVPTKRGMPLRLLSSEKAYDEDWIEQFEEERHPPQITKLVAALEEETDFEALPDMIKEAVADRLAFAAWGADDNWPGLVVTILMDATRLGLVVDGTFGDRETDVVKLLTKQINQDLVGMLYDMPARRLAEGMLFADERYDGWDSALLVKLPKMTMSVLTAAAEFLIETGGEMPLRDTLSSLFSSRQATGEILLWTLRNDVRNIAWKLVPKGEMLLQVVECLEENLGGDQLRTQNQLRALMEDGDALGPQLEFLTDDQRIFLLQRVNVSSGWDEVGRRAVIGGMIKAHPELQQQLLAKSDRKQVKARPRVTSWRSYRERQRHLKQLLEVDIPENAAEIAVATSYGDLRENAEYKYAKEHQTVLYCRRDDINTDLKVVRGVDFASEAMDVVGVGSTVTIQTAAARKTYTILGEWDRDEALEIISCKSRLAEVLDGLACGEKTTIPSETGEEEAEVVAIDALSPDVMAWLAATPEVATA
jgi:transcription elongation GreA/GreB family factor